MGWICVANFVCNCLFKFEQNTLIFMLNPCHVVNVFLAVVSLRSYSRIGELSALCVYAFSFGGYIGIIFNENEELSQKELVLYYVEHAFASALGPLILSLSGRYDLRTYAKFPLPLFGFGLFSFYMRYVLMPVSALTWANLNHTLCGVDNDPFYKAFDLGKSFYFWSELYLLFSCCVGYLVNYVIITTAFYLLSILNLGSAYKQRKE